jgi:hypothetical protein
MSNVPHDPKSPVAPVIEAGHAREAVLVALANLAKAMGELEAITTAIARALDATVEPAT